MYTLKAFKTVAQFWHMFHDSYVVDTDFILWNHVYKL